MRPKRSAAKRDVYKTEAVEYMSRMTGLRMEVSWFDGKNGLRVWKADGEDLYFVGPWIKRDNAICVGPFTTLVAAETALELAA